MGLAVFQAKTINYDSGKAGSVLLNSDGISKLRLEGSDDSFFEYALREDDIVKDKYVVDETLTTSDDIFTANSVVAYTLPVHEDPNDSTSSTTNKVIDPTKIRKGIGLPSDATKSLLWIQRGGKVEKILVDKALQTIDDYVGTGTTTSTSTSSSSTSTTSTSTS